MLPGNLIFTAKLNFVALYSFSCLGVYNFSSLQFVPVLKTRLALK
jgi:hypothetical protein